MMFFIALNSGSAPGEGLSKAPASACSSEGDLGAQFPHWLLPLDRSQAPAMPKRPGALSALLPGPENSKVGVHAQESRLLRLLPPPTMLQCLNCRGATKAFNLRGHRSRTGKCGKPGVWHDYFGFCY